MTMRRLDPAIHSDDDEHFEPQRGLPEYLPEGEHILWQGSPHTAEIAKRVFHQNKICVYFLVLGVWSLISGVYDGSSAVQIGQVTLTVLGVGLLALVLLRWVAYATAKHSVYTLTNKRIVLAIGVALQIRLNLPLREVHAVNLKRYRRDFGDISIVLAPENKLSAAVLWPHLRPWRWSTPEPALRCLPDSERVAEKITQCLMADSAEQAGEMQLRPGASQLVPVSS